MLCSWCGDKRSAFVCRIGRVLKPSCRGCTWRLRLSVRFDGFFLSDLRAQTLRS